MTTTSRVSFHRSAGNSRRKSNMTKYNVSISIDVECEDAYEAAYSVYRLVIERLSSPSRGRVDSRVTNTETGDAIDIDLFDGVLEVNPLLASQVIGFRHLIWISQNPPRGNKSK